MKVSVVCYDLGGKSEVHCIIAISYQSLLSSESYI